MCRRGLRKQVVDGQDDCGKHVGYAGIAGHKLETLFLHPDYFKKGIGAGFWKRPLQHIRLRRLTLTNRIRRRRYFMNIWGEVYAQDEFDGQGNHFPILHLRLK